MLKKSKKGENQMTKLILAILFSTIGLSAHASNISDGTTSIAPQPPINHPAGPTYFNWGQGRDGWAYCYEFNSQGYVLNGGRPVANIHCERVSPSYHNWGRGVDGWGYCYQFAPNGLVMNQGRPQPNMQCERMSPSYYQWGRGTDGWVYCYQWTPYGHVMNIGRPVPNHFCQR